MIDYEKKALCILMMISLRGSWGTSPLMRANKVLSLAKELSWDKTIYLTQEYINDYHEYEDADGRHFRCDFLKWGGYENHGLDILRDFFSYSQEFQKQALRWLPYIENLFDDIQVFHD